MEAYSLNLLRVAPRTFTSWDRPPHSVPLESLVDLGVVGFVLLVVMFVLVFRTMSRIRRGDPLFDLRVGLTAALTAVLVASLFIDNISEKYLWLVLATIMQLRVVARPQPVEQPRFAYEPPERFDRLEARGAPS